MLLYPIIYNNMTSKLVWKYQGPDQVFEIIYFIIKIQQVRNAITKYKLFTRGLN